MAEGRSDPQPGDLIEVDRPGYQHWALYMGDGYIIYVKSKAGAFCEMSIRVRMAKVMKELLKEVVGNHKWCVNSKYDNFYAPRPMEDILWSAEQWIGKEMTYDVLGSNCEHFMTMLRYGEGVSDQVSARGEPWVPPRAAPGCWL
ncbi:phospholipase A and acyltransferase 1-like [Melozone crissalis]|uniref:phospholipase A and acyltransferase 1-like n=1 Tax=Melozone crissalis TaxID=40204 RepID=UPI0023DBE77D|nr:phospholipase A and acyltransferase 1-like [Melozone crissalis]